MLSKGTRLSIAKSVGVSLRIARNHGHRGEEKHPQKQDDLTTAQPELCFSEHSYGQDVENTIARVGDYLVFI